MAAKELPSQKMLLHLLRYDGETGKLYWLNHPSRNVVIGTEALTAFTARGYRRGGVLYKNFMAHRVIWKMAYGTEPREIDHINGDRADNRLANLREADRTLNNRNAKRKKNNTAGRSGVYPIKHRWAATIGANGQQIWLGRFDSLADAIAAREAAEARYGYPPNDRR